MTNCFDDDVILCHNGGMVGLLKTSRAMARLLEMRNSGSRVRRLLRQRIRAIAAAGNVAHSRNKLQITCTSD